MNNSLLHLGSSIGILGGGQLGRMIAMSCIELGYKSFVYCPKGDNPAVEVSSQHIIGDWNNDLLLNKFISSSSKSILSSFLILLGLPPLGEIIIEALGSSSWVIFGLTLVNG